MKAHKYWSIGALITMLGTFYTGYKGSKEGHKYFAASSLLCMVMAIYTGHKMISGKSIGKSRDAGVAQFTDEDDEVMKNSESISIMPIEIIQ